jgi:hypothetical protein
MSTPCTPTLGDLRRLLLDPEVRAGKYMIYFDAQDATGGYYIAACVTRDTCARLLDGEFDELPDAMPIEELDQGPPHLGPWLPDEEAG